MNEKCFCHLNGLAVKDATARKVIEELVVAFSDTQLALAELNSRVTNIESITIAEGVSV